MIQRWSVVQDGVVFKRGQDVSGPELQKVNSSLIHRQPHGLGPIRSKRLLKMKKSFKFKCFEKKIFMLTYSDIKQCCLMERPALNEVQEGLNAAYKQLRELLATFRIQIDAPGLEPALIGTVAEFRDAFGVTRRHAVPLLEWLDREGWTVRRGDLRSLRERAAG